MDEQAGKSYRGVVSFAFHNEALRETRIQSGEKVGGGNKYGEERRGKTRKIKQRNET